MFPDAPSPMPQFVFQDDRKDDARIGSPTNSRPCESCLTGFFLGLAAGFAMACVAAGRIDDR